VPGATEAEIVAEPVKFTEPRLIDAAPPAKALDRTPSKGWPLFGQVPRMLTVWPAVTVPGFTIS
jgi:hypothetical protein